jgi:hypothetical protein
MVLAYRLSIGALDLRLVASASSTPSAASTAAAAAAAAATAAVGGIVDSDAAAVEVSAVHFLKGSLCLVLVGVGDEAEASAAPGVPIKDNLGLEHVAKLSEGVAQ